jgi:hypothetical protein
MRRSPLATIALFIGLQVPVPGSGFQVQVPVQVPGSLRATVSRADLVYTTPVTRSEEAIPIGNGRIAARVWTTPSALKFQIDRVDIQPVNRFVDLELAGAGAEVFTAAGTHQRLSIYEGLLDVRAAGVSARMLAWPERDVIAIEVDDRRAVPQPIQITTAGSQIAVRGGRILLTQNVQEGIRLTKSALAIALLGRRTLTQVATATEARIVTPAERGRVVILIASPATIGADQDVAAAALGNLDAAAAKSFDDLAGDTAEWWHNFWQQSPMASNSADATAMKGADGYHYHLYLTRATGTLLTLRDPFVP